MCVITNEYYDTVSRKEIQLTYIKLEIPSHQMCQDESSIVLKRKTFRTSLYNYRYYQITYTAANSYVSKNSRYWIFTCGAVTANPAGAHECTAGYWRGSCCSIFSFMRCGSLFVLLLLFFLAIVLSVLLKRPRLHHTTTDTIKLHKLPANSYLSKNSRHRI
jgi:hypothetical protein